MAPRTHQDAIADAKRYALHSVTPQYVCKGGFGYMVRTTPPAAGIAYTIVHPNGKTEKQEIPRT